MHALIPWWWLIPAIFISGSIGALLIGMIASNKCNDCLREQYEIESRRMIALGKLKIQNLINPGGKA